MPVTWEKGSEDDGPLVADRNLWLDASGNGVVEHGDVAAATLLAAEGHPILRADSDRLGLVAGKDGKVTQNRAVKIEQHKKLVSDLEAEKKAMGESISKYQADHATKDIPNTMEKARVDLENRHDHARMTLAQFVKASRGMDPTLGESQATAVRPEKSPTAISATKRANTAVRTAPTAGELAKSAPTKEAQDKGEDPGALAKRTNAANADKPASKSPAKESAAKSAKKGKGK